MTEIAHSSWNRMKQAVTRFVHDEDGLGTLEIVMILAIAAMVALMIYFFGQKIIDWTGGRVDEVTGQTEFNQPGGSGTGTK